MLIAVLDTNTLISALFWRGIPWQVYEAARAEKYQIITSEVLTAELATVTQRPKFAALFQQFGITAEAVVVEYRQIAETVTPTDIPPDAVRDPKDVAVLACAVGGRANAIVSGDRDLLDLGSYADIPILSAAAFLERLTQADS